MIATTHISNEHEFVSLVLDAVELPDFKFNFIFNCRPDLRTLEGENYPFGLIEVLCFSGMRIARHPLSIANRLQVTLTEIKGILEKRNDDAFCHAMAIAIAKALGKDVSLIESKSKWVVVN